MKPRILVVEDEPAISEPLAEHLEREGFDTEVAAHARGCPSRLRADATRPDPARRHAPRRRRPGSLPARSGRAPTSRSSCSPRAARRSTGSSGSSWAPTTTWSSRSPPASSSRASARSCAAAARPRARADRGRRHPPRPGLAHRHEGRRTGRARGEGVRPAPLLMANAGQVVRRETSWTRSGIRTGSGRRRRSTSTSPGSARSSRTTPANPGTSPRSAAWASGSRRRGQRRH